MARLRVRLKGKTVQEVPLEAGQTYIAGRKEDCDIVLKPEKGISREHFKITSNSEGHWSVEVISRYGEVIHNGDKVQAFDLKHGSIFVIPPYEFDFLEYEEDAEHAKEHHSENMPAVVDTAGMPVAEKSSEEFEERTVVGVAPMSAFIKIADSNSEAKELIRLDDGDSWIAGRDPTCHVHIRDQRVSRRQFEVRRQGSQFQIVDLGSVNGTLLNGNPLSTGEFINLKSGDAISVLDNYLYFELHDSQFQRRLEMVQVSPLSPLAIGESQYNLPMEYGGPAEGGMAPYQSDASFPSGELALEGKWDRIKNFDYKKNRAKVIAAAVIILAVAYLFSGEGGDKKVAIGLSSPSQQAFASLSQEQQSLVRQRYKDAKNLYMQGKYQLAQDEIVKIMEVVPDYEDIREIERLSKEAIFIQEQQRRQEQIEVARIEMEEKIQTKVTECKLLLSPNITTEKIEECLSSVMQFNPEHAGILEVKAQAQAIADQRAADAADRAEYQSRVARLRDLYRKADSMYKKGKTLDAISEFDKVVNSSLPDPNGLKVQSKRNIASIRQMMGTKTAALLAESEKLYQSQSIKGAILALRKARSIDPTNPEFTEKIDKYMTELRKQMMALFQEGILEESFGNVDGGENKSGAKEKWKKILELDVPDGEYYKKATIKLKKYGAL